MTVFTRTATDVYAPTTASGNARGVDMTEGQAYHLEIEAFISLVLNTGAFRVYGTLAELNADLAPAANSAGLVLNDISANVGIYRKIGAADAGSWEKISSIIPGQQVIAGTGGGTANAITVSTAVPVPAGDASALILLNVVAENTASPVTVKFNDDAIRTVKTASGNDVPIGGFTAGMSVIGAIGDGGTTFRLYSDHASAAIQAAAEAARVAAEAALASTVSLMSAVAQPIFAKKSDAEAYSPDVAPIYLLLTGYSTNADGGGAIYKQVGSEPGHAGKFSITTTAPATVWYEIAEATLNHRMFGGGLAGLELAVAVAAAQGVAVRPLDFVSPAVNSNGPISAAIEGVTSFPIRKKARTNVVALSTRFDGTRWLQTGAALTGLADGKAGTVHFLAEFLAGGDGATQSILAMLTNRFHIFKDAAGIINVRGSNAADTNILTLQTATAYTSASGKLAVTASWDLVAGTGKIFVNGVDDTAPGSVLTNDTIAYVTTSYYMGAFNGANILNADLADLWFDTSYNDLTNLATLRRFQTKNGLGIHLYGDGSAGKSSEGSKPILYCTGSTGSVRHNRGSSETDFAVAAGNFTAAKGADFIGSQYKDLAPNDVQIGSRWQCTYDAVEGQLVVPIGLKRARGSQDFGATGAINKFYAPLHLDWIDFEPTGPGGGGGGGSTSTCGGGGGAGARGKQEFLVPIDGGGVRLEIQVAPGALGGVGTGAGTAGTGNTSANRTEVRFPAGLGGLHLMAGAGQGGKGAGGPNSGRGGLAGNMAQNTPDQGGSGAYPHDWYPTQNNIGQANGGDGGPDSNGNHVPGFGGYEGDSGGGGRGGVAQATGTISSGGFCHVEWTTIQ